MPDTTVELYRSVRKEDFPDGVVVNDFAVAGVLFPSFADSTYQIKQGTKTVSRTRSADIRPYPHQGQSVVSAGGGTSLFDKANVFGKKYWHCFTIPKDTPIPASLQVIFTGRNATYDADHYQIEPLNRMTLQAFKDALDNLARAAVTKLVEAAH